MILSGEMIKVGFSGKVAFELRQMMERATPAVCVREDCPCKGPAMVPSLIMLKEQNKSPPCVGRVVRESSHRDVALDFMKHKGKLLSECPM